MRLETVLLENCDFLLKNSVFWPYIGLKTGLWAQLAGFASISGPAILLGFLIFDTTCGCVEHIDRRKSVGDDRKRCGKNRRVGV